MSAGIDHYDTKRQAMSGQWTAPAPVAYNPQASQQVQNPASSTGVPNPLLGAPAAPAPANTTTVNESSEYYAQALQEAYRRGAEAAAKLHHPQPTVASCPDLQQFQGSPRHPSNDPTIIPTLVPDPLANDPSAPPIRVPVAVFDSSRSASMPDIHSFDLRGQVEEAKRKKRLARNRDRKSVV